MADAAVSSVEHALENQRIGGLQIRVAAPCHDADAQPQKGLAVVAAVATEIPVLCGNRAEQPVLEEVTP
jgi:hypothetical protein